MKWFNRQKRHNEKEGEKNLLTQKIIKALNYTPVDYIHSDKFIADGQDPVGDMRIRLKNFSRDDLDYLCSTMLDPSINADTVNENVFGKQQQTHHINTILQLSDSATEEAAKVPYLKKVLTDDREKMVAERDKLLAIRESL